jgi:hypothetical protein
MKDEIEVDLPEGIFALRDSADEVLHISKGSPEIAEFWDKCFLSLELLAEQVRPGERLDLVIAQYSCSATVLNGGRCIAAALKLGHPVRKSLRRMLTQHAKKNPIGNADIDLALRRGAAANSDQG